MTIRDPRLDWARFEPGKIPTKTEIPELEAFLETVATGRRVLDLGCGSGRLSRILAERGYDVTGVDINERAMSDADAGGNPRFHVGDIASARGLDVLGAPFSVVVCQLVVSVIGGVPERRALLKNAFDALEPGGWLYLSASEVSDDVNPAYREVYEKDFPDTGERYTYFSRDAAGNILYSTHHFTGPELSALLLETGFEVVRLSSKTESSSRRPDEAANFLYAVGRKP